MDAVLITFSVNSKKFKSAYERNCFYRKLYGWNQIVNKPSGKYKYRRKGLVDKVPHIRVDNSVILIDRNAEDDFERFFKEWAEKVTFNMFKVMLEDRQRKMMFGR